MSPVAHPVPVCLKPVTATGEPDDSRCDYAISCEFDCTKYIAQQVVGKSARSICILKRKSRNKLEMERPLGRRVCLCRIYPATMDGVTPSSDSSGSHLGQIAGSVVWLHGKVIRGLGRVCRIILIQQSFSQMNIMAYQ